MSKLTPAQVYGKWNKPHTYGLEPARSRMNSREKPHDRRRGRASSWVRSIAATEMEGDALL